MAERETGERREREGPSLLSRLLPSFSSTSCFLLSLAFFASLDFVARVTILRDCSQSIEIEPNCLQFNTVHFIYTNIYWHLSLAVFVENHLNEICSRHLSKKALQGRLFGPDKPQNHSNEGKGKEKKKE